MTASVLGPAVAATSLAVAALMAGIERRLVAERLGGVRQEPRGDRAAALWGAGLCSAAAGLLVVGPTASIVAALGFLGWRILRRARSRELEVLEAERGLRDSVRALAASARAGLSIRRALDDVAREAPPGVGPAFGAAAQELAMGRPMPAALAALSGRLGSREGALLTGVLSIHHRSGGDLARALDEVADLAERRADARRRLRALTAQGRASGAVLAVLPVAFVGLLSGTSGSGLGTFYGTPRGAALLGVGIVLQVAGFLWIRAILRRAQP